MGVVDIQSLLLHDQWVQVGSTALLEALAVSEAASEVVLMEAEVVVDLEEVLIEVDLEEVVVVDEEESVIKVGEDLAIEVIVVGMGVEDPMAMLPLTHQLAREVVVVEVSMEVVVMVEEGAEVLEQDHQIVMVLEDPAVGMNLVVAAHMMTDPADTVATAIVAMVIAMEVLLVEAVAAIWSR